MPEKCSLTWIAARQSCWMPANDIYDTLQTMIGSQYVNQFAYQNRPWQVILQAGANYRQDPSAFDTM